MPSRVRLDSISETASRETFDDVFNFETAIVTATVQANFLSSPPARPYTSPESKCTAFLYAYTTLAQEAAI